MTSISVSAELAKAGIGNKPYLTTYSAHGFELGCAPPGHYPGHAHECFTDVMWSPGRLSCSAGHATASGQLLIVTPRTFFEVTFSDIFFFVKFCADPRPASLPDKITDRVFEGSVSVLSAPATFACSCYTGRGASALPLTIELTSACLRLDIGNRSFRIQR